MDKSTLEEKLSQILQTNNKPFKTAVTFLTRYENIFNNTTKNNNLFFTTSPEADAFNVYSVPLGAYEREALNSEIKRIIS